MSRRYRRGVDTLVRRGCTARQEWHEEEHFTQLLSQARVAAVVSARTGGRCYWPGCNDPIISYPHAVPQSERGVHHPLNRAGLCEIHANTLHSGGRAGEQYRLYLQDWLTDYYGQRGIDPERWQALATGQEMIRDLTSDLGQEVATG